MKHAEGSTLGRWMAAHIGQATEPQRDRNAYRKGVLHGIGWGVLAMVLVLIASIEMS